MKNGTPSTNPKDFLTPKEAADKLRVSVRTFYTYMKKPVSKGGPPVRRFGRNLIRLPRAEFFRWAGIEEKN